MKSGFLRSLFVGLLAACVASAAPAIGMVTAGGSLELDRAQVSSGTLFDGSRIATRGAAADLRLTGGTRVLLAPQSEASVHADRVIVQKGSAQVDGSGNSALLAGDLQVARDHGVTQVAVDGGTVHLAVRSGSVSVRSKSGILLARLNAGESARLETGASAPARTVRITGKVTESGGKYFIEDRLTHTVFELRGAEVKAWVGGQMEVSGELISPAVVQVTSAVRAVAAAGASKAVIAGIVIVSGAGAGLGLGLTHSEPEPTVSRR